MAASQTTPSSSNASQQSATGNIARRSFLKGSAVAGGVAMAGVLASQGQASAEDNPVFQHSVASGDPTANSVIIWTRVTPTPDAVPGSNRGAPTRVRWEMATDPGMGRIVRSGSVVTTAERDLTVKVDVTGLAPRTTYFYRFRVEEGPAAGAYSRIGRTLTAPDPGAAQPMRIGVCSCSNYEAGWFTAYRHMFERDDLDLVLHLGDYTYEYATGEYVGAFDDRVRPVQPPQRTTTLADYRIRQGCYRQDVDLANLHASVPFMCMWDDHEFADNWWREGATGSHDYEAQQWRDIYLAGKQAYFEWMPVRPNDVSESQHLYRRLRFGSLAEIILPDLRTYRDVQLSPGLAWFHKMDDPNRTLTGPQQYDWLAKSIATSPTKWQIIGNEIMIAPMTVPGSVDPQVNQWLVDKVGIPRDGFSFNNDQWDGYPAERRKLINDIKASGRRNVVFVTGDIHSSFVNAVPADVPSYRANPAAGEVVATEFVANSITAANVFDTVAKRRELAGVAHSVVDTAVNLLPMANPWMKQINFKQHGYGVLDITSERVQMDFWFVDTVLTPLAPVRNAWQWMTLDGQPGPVPAPSPLGPR